MRLPGHHRRLREGFDLTDHGTDLAIWLDGMPVNMPTHAHGQGYTDLNFVIPELIQTIHYRKGPYYAEVGDFGSAGAAERRVTSCGPDDGGLPAETAAGAPWTNSER